MASVTTTPDDRKTTRKSFAGTGIGNALEWYDWGIYSTLTAFIASHMFSKADPTSALLSTLAVFAVGFLARPLGGLLFGRSLLSVVLDSMFSLTEEGWRKLTFRWGVFFFVLAALNELVWRTQTEDFWVNFKVFGIMPITVLFALAQTPLLTRYERKAPLPEA